MSTIELNHLSFSYDSIQDPIFQDVSLYLDTSWHLGLVGRNGRGKTTLLNILQKKLPFTGTLHANLPIHYFPGNITDENQLTFYAIQDLTNAEQWQIERELNLLNAKPEILWRPFNSLSGGEQTKVLLALLFADNIGFALIDEPTNHLDAGSREHVANYLKHKSGFIVVSHDRHFLDEVTDHTLAIDRKQINLYQGNYSVYESAKNAQDNFELNQNEKLKHEITRLEQTAAEKGRWSMSRESDKLGKQHVKSSSFKGDAGFVGSRAARVMKKRISLENRMEKDISTKKGLLQNIETTSLLTINNLPDHHKNFLTAKDFNLSYSGDSLFEPISWEINPGDRVALVGPNGIGKSSIIQALLGNFAGEINGDLSLTSNLAISLVRQMYTDNIGLISDFAEKNKLDYQALLNNLKKLGIERNAFQTPIVHLSMGQQKKVEVAKSLVTPANLFIWDEPLNYLDVYNQDQLIESILASQPTMLFVEHDQNFIEKVATKVVELKPLS